MSKTLEQLITEFDDFLNEPPQYEDMRMVRDYRHEAYPKWIKVLTAAKAELEKCRNALQELVVLKSMKERIEEIESTIPDGKNIIDHPFYQQWQELHALYAGRKAAAWSAARAALEKKS